MQRICKLFFRSELLVIIAISVLIGGLFTLPANAVVIPRDGIAMLLPAHQELTGEESLRGGLLTPLTHTINVDEATGEIRITTVASDFTYQGSLDPSFQVRESIFIFKNKNMINLLGHDKRITRYDGVKKQLEIQYFLNGILKYLKKIPCDQNTVDTDTLIVFLQGMLLKKATNFNMYIISKSRGIRVHANFNLTTTNDLQQISPKYQFPDHFKRISKQVDGFYVYVMELTGLPNIIYPYKYFFAYRKESPYQLVAYWGGPLKEEEFGYIVE